MNYDLIIKLAKLANNNPNENEANLAARKVCKLLAEANFMFTQHNGDDSRRRSVSDDTWGDMYDIIRDMHRKQKEADARNAEHRRRAAEQKQQQEEKERQRQAEQAEYERQERERNQYRQEWSRPETWDFDPFKWSKEAEEQRAKDARRREEDAVKEAREKAKSDRERAERDKNWHRKYRKYGGRKPPWAD